MKMPKKIKIDVTSSVAEGVVKETKKFLGSLIMPSVKEVGLLTKDKVTEWRFRNQVNMLARSIKYCKKKGISPKVIPLKTMLPLLEAAGLEDDKFIQEKWAILLGNLVDSQTNAKTNIFPFILSQISKDELKRLESVNKEIVSTLIGLEKRMATVNKRFTSKSERLQESSAIEDSLRMAHYIQETEFQPAEIANLVRLGLLKAIPMQTGRHVGLHLEQDVWRQYRVTPGYVEIEHNFDYYVITGLGKIFLEMVNEKQSSERSKSSVS